jgi:hypothetical protein
VNERFVLSQWRQEAATLVAEIGPIQRAPARLTATYNMTAFTTAAAPHTAEPEGEPPRTAPMNRPMLPASVTKRKVGLTSQAVPRAGGGPLGARGDGFGDVAAAFDFDGVVRPGFDRFVRFWATGGA